MRTSLITRMGVCLATIGLALPAGVGFSAQPGSPPAEGTFARVEVRGVLRQVFSPFAVGGPATAVLVDNTSFPIDFAPRTEAAKTVEALLGKIVVLRGTLGGDQSPRSIRVVSIEAAPGHHAPWPFIPGTSNTLASFQAAKELLCGYQPGQAASALRLCKELGLEVVEVYHPGSYLKCRWADGVKAETIEILAKNPVIRYVEPNYGVEPISAGNPGRVPAPTSARPAESAPRTDRHVSGKHEKSGSIRTSKNYARLRARGTLKRTVEGRELLILDRTGVTLFFRSAGPDRTEAETIVGQSVQLAGSLEPATDPSVSTPWICRVDYLKADPIPQAPPESKSEGTPK